MIIAIGALLTAIGTAIKVLYDWRKTSALLPHEKQEKDSTAAERYLDIANKASERLEKQNKRIDVLALEIQDLKRKSYEQSREIAKLKKKNKELETDLERYADLAKRLVEQVKFIDPEVEPEGLE